MVAGGAHGTSGVLRVTMRNQRLRYLSAYAEFFDTGGRPMRSGPLAHLSLAARLLVDVHPTKRYVEMLPPVDTVFGIPILPPYAVTMNIPFPEGAAKMRLYYGGFGTGKYDEDVCPPGYVCTVMMNLVVPNLLLIAGAAEYKTQFIANLMKDRTVLYGVFALIAAIGSGTYIGLSQDPGRAAKAVARIVGPMLLKPALKVLLGYLGSRFAIGWAQRAIPFLTQRLSRSARLSPRRNSARRPRPSCSRRGSTTTRSPAPSTSWSGFFPIRSSEGSPPPRQAARADRL